MRLDASGVPDLLPPAVAVFCKLPLYLPGLSAMSGGGENNNDDEVLVNGHTGCYRVTEIRQQI